MLTDGILANAQKIRFHTPGHGELPADLLKVDVTELPYSDNLAHPVGEIGELEKFLASAYGAEAAFLSTQGATHNVHQAVYATKDDGAFLIVGKAHLSVYNAMRLFDCVAYHADSLDLSVIPSDVKTVVLTSPDYFGRTVDLPSVCPSLHQKGLSVIIDSAHGAHFAFSSRLPVSATEYGDLVVVSQHKTMPVLTGGSVLLTKKRYEEKCRYCRTLLHTTSPNYMVMCSIERATKLFLHDGERIFDEIHSAVRAFKKELRPPFSVVETDDFSRLVLASPYDGRAVYDALFSRGFVAETSYENKVVFIVTSANYFFLPTLCRIVGELPALSLYERENEVFCPHPRPQRLTFAKSFFTMELKEAVGKRAFNEVGLYPPGAPALYPGDVITEEIAAYLSDHAEKTFGLENHRVRVIQ